MVLTGQPILALHIHSISHSQRGKSFDGPAGLRYNFPRRSRVAQRQSNRLLTGGL